MSFTNNEAFQYFAIVVAILLLGLGYYLLDKYVFSKMKEEK